MTGRSSTTAPNAWSSSMTPSKPFPAFKDRGTLNVGAPADVAVLELRQGNFPFLDNYGGSRTGTQRLFPVETVIGGKRAARV